ncbi:MAG: thioesterase family protein [Rikenellaceae bacterium]
MELVKGLSAESKTVVDSANTAIALGSGDMEVFATPAMVALMENAAMNAVSAALAEGMTTVGTEISTSHIKASALGAKITATAVVTEVEGRKITFNVGAVDEDGIIGEGVHTRFIVDREKFLSKVNKK